MFKKKPNIPPRPKPPVGEQVLDDIKNAPEDDVVFTIMNPHESSKAKSVLSTQDDAAVSEDDPEVVYQKVRNFLEANSSLQSMLDTLKEKNEELLKSDIEIKKMAEDIRKQAIDAVK